MNLLQETLAGSDTERAAFIASVQKQAAENDTAGYAGAVFDQMQSMEANIKASVTEALGYARDEEITVARGGVKLTAKEKKFWDAQIAAAKHDSKGAVTAALTGADVVLPETVFDRVFDDLTENYPLLGAISFTNTAALMKFYFASSAGEATWGELTGDIGDELTGDFEKNTLDLKKLSARMVIPRAYLDLGPVWIDRFVRTILLNRLAKGLERAIVDGDGKNKPIGMTRKLTGATDSVYPRKTPMTLNSLDPVSIGGILAQVSKTPNGYDRDVPCLLMVCNPTDYFTKVYPGVTPRAADGSWRKDAMPYDITVVKSGALPVGKAVIGLADKYFCALGNGQGGKLEFDDSVKFFEHQRGYRIFLYGNGRAEDENAFVYCDISGLTPAVLDVRVTPAAPEA